MLLVRRRAPDGGYFNDGDRAAGVFGVLATGFSVLLGFIVFLAFDELRRARGPARRPRRSWSPSRSRPPSSSPRRLAADLTGQLICYGRSVVYGEWPKMEDGTPGSIASTRGASSCSGRSGPSSRIGERGGGLRQVARPDLGPGGSPPRPGPRRGGGHPVAALDRALPPPRSSSSSCCSSPTAASARSFRPSSWARRRRDRDRDAAPARLPRPPVPAGRRRLRPVAMERTLADHRRGAASSST